MGVRRNCFRDPLNGEGCGLCSWPANPNCGSRAWLRPPEQLLGWPFTCPLRRGWMMLARYDTNYELPATSYRRYPRKRHKVKARINANVKMRRDLKRRRLDAVRVANGGPSGYHHSGEHRSKIESCRPRQVRVRSRSPQCVTGGRRPIDDPTGAQSARLTSSPAVARARLVAICATACLKVDRTRVRRMRRDRASSPA